MTHSPSTGQRPSDNARSYDKAWRERYWLVQQRRTIGIPAIVALLSVLIACIGLLAPAEAVPANLLPSPSAKALGHLAGDDGLGCSLSTHFTAVAASGRLRLRHDLVGPLRCTRTEPI